MAKVFKSDLIGVQESVVDALLLLNPHQIPLISRVGFADPVYNTKHEWIEDEMFAYESQINDADGVLAGDGTITVDDGSIFRAGHIVKVGEELMKVTNVSGNVLTVNRGYAGTTPAAHSDNDKVEILFVEGQEGADARAARYKQRVRQENYTQIFDDTIEISGTALALAQYGIDNLYAHEQAKKQVEVALQLEKALINGIKFESNQVRQMRGIRSFISTNVVDATAGYESAELSMDMINDLAQDIYEKGGFASGANHVVMVPAKQKRALSSLDANAVRIDRDDTARGQVAERLVTDFGEFPIVLNNNLAADELMLVDLNRVFIRPLNGREFFHEYMGKKGDYITGQIVGEYTLEFRQEKAHGRIKKLA
jgi:hypothetical protein